VRKALGLRQGDEIAYLIEDGRVVMSKGRLID
jgi:bifunctional DNA-binding transcriptional regulator/antitoxin component of YhaV-PrlF toxin-antitoxin module